MPLTASRKDIDRPAAVSGAPGEQLPGTLVARLRAALESSGIPYCQWKGSAKVERWTSGEGDIDLLADRASEGALTQVFESLGFKLALAAPQVPGVVSWIGHDTQFSRLIHVHLHYKLILGRAETRHYHLAIERVVLKSALPGLFFKTPSPELEYFLFVLQQTLRHDPLVAPGNTTERLALLQPELRRLQQQSNADTLARFITTHVPDLTVDDFRRCVTSLDPRQPHLRRLRTAWMLASRLAAHAHGGGAAHYARRIARKLARAIGPNDVESGKGPVGGGLVIALLGADGAGKSTCARHLVQWLGTELRTCHAHLGRPPRTWSTMLAGLALKLGRALERMRGSEAPWSVVAHLELLRHLCTARDRYLLFQRLQRFAASGGIAICERYPIRESWSLAGPSKVQGLALDAQSRTARGMRELERSLYCRITPPDLSIVLRVEPEVAVRRKTDEPEEYVRARARRMWTTDWTSANAVVMDAGRDLEDVITDLKAIVWRAL
jgi:thymidylate kinase